MASSINIAQIPTRKSEYWRYTSLRGVFEPHMTLLKSTLSGVEKSVDSVARDWQGPRVVFANGSYAPEFSKLQGIQISVSAQDRVIYGEDSFFGSLLAESPKTVISIAGNLTLPLMILNIVSLGESHEAHLNLTNLSVQVAPNVQAQVIYRFASSDESSAVTSVVGLSEQVGSNSQYESLILRDSSFKGSLLLDHQVAQFANSTGTWHSVVSGGDLTRVNLNARADGLNTQTNLFGCYLLHGQEREQADFNTRLEHLSPDQKSEQIYRGVLDGKSIGVFRGKIHIHQGCPRVDSRQLNQNIVLSKTAEVNTLPQLQIDTDDVKATHGATVGQLQEEELFYLQSRALDERTAKRMVLEGFLRELVQRIESLQIREMASQSISTWLQRM